MFSKNYVDLKNNRESSNFVHNECFKMTYGATLYDTGPYMYDLAFLKTYKLKEDDQIVVAPDIDVEHHWSALLKLSNGEIIEIKVAGEQPGQGSWSDDFNDSLIFGWPSLNKLKF